MTPSRRPLVEMPLRVRYHECDGQGIVFNAHYQSYVDMASFEVVKALFGSYDAFLATGTDMVVAEANLRYRAPCRYDDDLVVAVFLAHLGTTSIVYESEIRRGGKLTTEAKVRYVLVDPETLRKQAIPAAVRDVYAAHLPVPTAP
ncbi:thioesterase family protein [Amycolatopsis sp. NPDC049253]|uniref:acyl-CoA thioesterase n=1 Tax=Amycolatopsis sp. NPDC049253 TaxID=3155274 RepID=UPI0034390483